MRTYILSLLFLAFSPTVVGQEPICVGQTFKIHSSILNEERELEIQLPKNYNNPNFDLGRYPVLYVLDGESNFQVVAAIEKFDTKFLYRSHPEMIVVGIKNTDRIRDLTPTHFEPRYKTSGGADNFIQFIEEELKPYINSNFRANGYDVLHGHSFGGLFTLYTLLEKPELFQSYIAIDPSLWWDNKFVLKRAKEKSIAFENTTLFVALASEKEKFEHSATIRSFCKEFLDGKSHTFWKYYPDYHHGSVPVPATMDALKAIFEGMELAIKEIPENPELILESYKEVSEKLNFEFFPDESLLYDLIKFTGSSGRKENVTKILDFALSIYPNSQQLKVLKDKQ